MVQNVLWEDDPLSLMAHDAQRKMLWTATEKGSLSLYDLGDDGQGVQRVASYSISQIMSAATKAAPQLEKSLYSQIVMISVISAGFSRALHLVAITGSGIRLYFTAGTSKRPSTIQVKIFKRIIF